MLKKVIVLSLLTIVAIAVGTSIYNANAAQQVNVQEEVISSTTPEQSPQPQAEASAATITEEVPALSQPGTVQATAGQNQGFHGSARDTGGAGGTGSGNGNGRQGGKGTQANATSGSGIGQAGGAGMSAGRGQGANAGQGTAGASRRPSWAGQGGQP